MNKIEEGSSGAERWFDEWFEREIIKIPIKKEYERVNKMKKETNKQYIINALSYSFYYMIIFASISISLFITGQIINKGCVNINSISFLIISFGFGWAIFHIKRLNKMKEQ